MNDLFYAEDIIETLNRHMRYFLGNEIAESVILSIGADLLGISEESVWDLISR